MKGSERLLDSVRLDYNTSRSTDFVGEDEDNDPLLYTLSDGDVRRTSFRSKQQAGLPPTATPLTGMANPSGTKLGTFRGVFIPCSLKVFAILFLRIGYGVGQAGLLQMLGVVALASTVDILTLLSLSAISTNGRVKSGGVYYMISRALGPDFGAMIGLVFYLGMVLGVSFFIAGFAEELEHMGVTVTDNHSWNLFATASSGLAVLASMALVGAGLYSVFGAGIIIFGSFGMALLFFSLVSRKPGSVDGYTGWTYDTLHMNWNANYDKDVDFFVVFAIIFPGFTGLLSGANMSGDLANPSISIPYGTMYSLGFQIAAYSMFALLCAATFESDELKDNSSLLNEVVYTWAKIIIEIAALISTFGSAMTAVVGASRVLQALAKDGVIPLLSPFAWGTKKKNEPRRGVILTWILAQLFLFLGNLDTMAPYITMMYVFAFLLTNLACFALRIASTANFRPTFKYYSWQTSLAGALLCFVVMMCVNVLSAMMTLLLAVAVFTYVNLRAPIMPWGDVSEALIFHQVRKFLLRLDTTQVHVKNWRANILFLVTGNITRETVYLMDFLNKMKKGGLFVVCEILMGSFAQVLQLRTQRGLLWSDFVHESKIKAFCRVTIAATIREGIQSILLNIGLGSLRPNTIVISFPEELVSLSSSSSSTSPQQQQQSGGNILEDLGVYSRAAAAQLLRDNRCVASLNKSEYMDIIRDTLMCGKNIVVARRFAFLDPNFIDVPKFTSSSSSIPGSSSSSSSSSSSFSASAMAMMAKRRNRRRRDQQTKNNVYYIDVWCLMTPNWATTLTLCLQLAYLLNLTSTWKNAILRIVSVVASADRIEKETRSLNRFLTLIRMTAVIKVLAISFPDAALTSATSSSSSSSSAFPDTVDYEKLSSMEKCSLYNSLIKNISKDAVVAYLPLMPLPHASEASKMGDYLEELRVLTDDLPPCLLVLASDQKDIDTNLHFPSIVSI